MYDPQGANAKVRPLVVISPTHEISDTQPMAVVAITSAFSDPLNDDEIPLPHHPAGRAATGLRKPSVAKCTWQEAIRGGDVIEIKGFVSSKVLTRILVKVIQLGEGKTAGE